MCGIDKELDSLYWRIHDGSNNADEFSRDIETACSNGYLYDGHVLVLDNAFIHAGADNRPRVSLGMLQCICIVLAYNKS